jgi:hypothetical protein
MRSSPGRGQLAELEQKPPQEIANVARNGTGQAAAGRSATRSAGESGRERFTELYKAGARTQREFELYGRATGLPGSAAEAQSRIDSVRARSIW